MSESASSSKATIQETVFYEGGPARGDLVVGLLLALTILGLPLAVAAFVLGLNLLGMRYAKIFMSKIGMTPLLVLGAVFGVLQVALGVEMMANGWQAWSTH